MYVCVCIHIHGYLSYCLMVSSLVSHILKREIDPYWVPHTSILLLKHHTLLHIFFVIF